MRKRFNFKTIEYGDRTCIIVVDIDGISTGLIVDEVSEVLDIPEGDVDAPPKTNKGEHSRFIQGMGKVGDEVKIILNISKLLNDTEKEDLSQIAHKGDF